VRFFVAFSRVHQLVCSLALLNGRIARIGLGSKV
jgi:hypothetical protein